MEQTKYTDCTLQFSSSSDDEESNDQNNYLNNNLNHHFLENNQKLNFQNSNLLNSSQNKKFIKKPCPAPRSKHLNKQQLTFNQRNLIKNLNQQQVGDSTFTPQLLHKQLFMNDNRSNFVRTGSLDRKLQEVRKLNFSEMKLRLKQQQQEIEKNLLKKNLITINQANNENHNLTSDLKTKHVINDLNNSINKLHLINKPPTPPQHKIPNWETKFYKLALNSINQITSESTQNRYSNDDHWYLLDNKINSEFLNLENDFLKIDRLPIYKNFNQTIIRIDNLNEETSSRIDNEINDREKCIDNENEFNDYDLPPDAYKKTLATSSKLDDYFNRNNQLRQSKFIESQIESLEKSGYLLCNKNKNWKQRYFVLKNKIIYYYKTQTDVKKNKLKGSIKLTNDINIIRNENSSSFQILDNKLKLIFTLTADSVLTMEDWVRVIKNNLKSNDKTINDRNDQTIELNDWLIRRKNGYSKKLWTILKDKKLYFYKNTNCEQLISCLDLNEFKILESLLESSLTKDDLILNDDYRKEYVIMLENQNKDYVPIYLVLNDKKSFNNWIYHLTISTIENISTLTEFEKLIVKLMSIPIQNDDFTNLDTNQLWFDQLLIYAKDDNLNQSLTNLENHNLKCEALKLFKSIQLFIQIKINIQSGIEYHVALVQGIFETCFEYNQLQNELFCQLIKQSSIAYNQSNCTFNFIQSFQLLSLAVSIFIPKGKVLWLLKNFLRRNATDETEYGKYAIYCQRTLERCLTNGNREVKPSRLEILAILLRNPYYHSLPFSIPVYFTNNNYTVFSFDGLTTVEEFVKQICEQSEIRPITQSGYALYSDDPINVSKIHFLPWRCKLGDIISRWETSLKNNNLGKFESKRVIKLIFKKRLFFKSNTKSESEKEKILFVYQLNQDLMNSKIPISDNNLLVHLTALMILLENGKINDDQQLKKEIDKFYPKKDLDNQILNQIKSLIEQMGNLTKKDCIRIYLNCVKKWPIFGSNLFEAFILNNRKSVYLTVDEIYFYILDKDFKIISNYFLNRFLKFGHKDDKLIIYLFNRIECSSNSSVTRSSFIRNDSSNSFNQTQNERLEFQMDKDKINEFILLIADYLNVENSIKFERLTNDTTSQTTTTNLSPFELTKFSPTNEIPNSSLYDIKQYGGNKLNRNDSFNRSTNSFNNNGVLKEDEQEYSEIYSPPYENQEDFSILSNHSTNNSNLPPILPLHRCPTWEKNLYTLCSSNFNHFIENSNHDLKSILQHNHLKDHNDLKDDQLSDFQKKHCSISSMISGEYYTNQFCNRNLNQDLSNEFSSISQYSLSKKSSISRCNSDNSSSLNDDNFILKDNLLVLSKKQKWKKRIVLIKNFSIYHFKNEHDLNKNKFKGKFKINSKTIFEEDEKGFRLVDNQNQKSISLSSENAIKLKQLTVVILNLIEKSNFKNIENQDSIIEGWLDIIKNGICTRKYCKLKDRILFFYQESTDDNVYLILNLAENIVEEAESNDYEFADWTQSLNIERKKEFSISIESECKSNSIYLVFNEKKDFDVWFYHLSIAGNKVIVDKSIDKTDSCLLEKLTPFEQIISKLMRIEYTEGLIALESSYLWNESPINSITESINQSLTTLKSTTLNNEALKLYKSIYLFSTVEIKSHAIDYHITLAQGSIELCLDYSELQNEMYCQLIKLSNASNQNSNKLMRAIDRSNQDDHITLQALQLFSIAISIFIPKGKILWFVKHFLRRQSNEHSNTGRYAIYITKALDRAMQNGNRDFRPSRMEILGILLRNPNQHSSPHSIPVHFLNKEYLVIGFDGSTTIEEFNEQIRKELGLNSFKKTEFALYCDNPIQDNCEHYLQPNLKLSDIISQWEQCLRKKLGRFENNKVVRLIFKIRQYFKKKSENDKDRLFLAYKICEDIKQNRFPINHDLAIQLTSLLTQCECGNLDNYSQNNQLDKIIDNTIDKFYPIHLKSKVHSVFLIHDLKSKWIELKNILPQDCIRVYLNCTKKWSLFGSTLFQAKTTTSIKVELTLSKYQIPSNQSVWLSIDENNVSILDFHNYQQINQFKLRNIIKFGGENDKFVLVVKRCLDEFDLLNTNNLSLNTIKDINYERFIFNMDRLLIYELTLLIKDYLIVQFNCI